MCGIKYFILILLTTFVVAYEGLNPCLTHEDCDYLENSQCQDGVCICNGKKFCQQKTNRIVTKIGEKCGHTEECNVNNSECSDEKKCECKATFVKSTNGKKCLAVSHGIGGNCEDSVQCYTKTAHTGCQDNKCVCQQHMHEHNGSCYRNVDIGDYCIHDGECSYIPFTKCVNSKCECTSRYVKSTKSSRCLPLVDGEKSPCVDSAQCTGTLGLGSECRDGFCRCKDFHAVKKSINKCVKDMLIGEPCQTNKDCYENPSKESQLECIIGVCKCKSIYTEMKGLCSGSSTDLERPTMLFAYMISAFSFVVSILFM